MRHELTDGWIKNGRTDGRMDKVFYGDARAHLKMEKEDI